MRVSNGRGSNSGRRQHRRGQRSGLTRGPSKLSTLNVILLHKIGDGGQQQDGGVSYQPVLVGWVKGHRRQVSSQTGEHHLVNQREETDPRGDLSLRGPEHPTWLPGPWFLFPPSFHFPRPPVVLSVLESHLRQAARWGRKAPEDTSTSPGRCWLRMRPRTRRERVSPKHTSLGGSTPNIPLPTEAQHQMHIFSRCSVIVALLFAEQTVKRELCV